LQVSTSGRSQSQLSRSRAHGVIRGNQMLKRMGKTNMPLKDGPISETRFGN
jgi:hypothetical protein